MWEGVSRKVLGTSLLRRWLIPGMTAAAALLLGTFLLIRPSSPSPDTIMADAGIKVKVNADVTPKSFEDPVTSTANDWVPGDNLSKKSQTDDIGKIQGRNGIDKTLSDKIIDRNPRETGIDQNRKAGAAESAEYSEEVTNVETVSAEAAPEPDNTNAAASKTSSEKEESIDNEVVRQAESAKWAAIMAEEQAERKHSARRFSAGISVTGAGPANSPRGSLRMPSWELTRWNPT